MQTVHIQGIGQCEAVLAKDLKVGMKRIYNYGFTATVVSVEFSASGKSIKETVRDDETGELYTNTRRANRLLPIVAE